MVLWSFVVVVVVVVVDIIDIGGGARVVTGAESWSWALVMLRKMVLMGESVHDGPGTNSANAALCAAWHWR